MISRRALAATLILLLGACGGGGGDSSSPAPAPSPTPAAATLALLAGNMGGPGNADGTGAQARFFLPAGVGVDADGNAYVADSGNHLVRKVTPAGAVSTLAGTPGLAGAADGTSARFKSPLALALDRQGNVYVADTGNNTIRKITSDGVVSTVAGSARLRGSADGSTAVATFDTPSGIAVDANGDLYVGDAGNAVVRKISVAAGQVSTIAGTAGLTGSTDAVGAAARFQSPTGVVVDAAGIVYVADTRAHTVRKIALDGTVSTLAGTAGVAGGADGVGAAASFELPQALAIDRNGNLLLADAGANTLRRIAPDGTTSTVAGASGSAGSSDGNGAAARFNGPQGVAVDANGRAFVADGGNHLLRSLAADASVSTLAGAVAVVGQSDGSAASFSAPYGIAADGTGAVLVADAGNNGVRKVLADGTVSTLAGAAAGLRSPQGVAVDGAGNLFVADQGNDVIRKITPAGVVSIFAGSSGVVGSADGAQARFDSPQAVAADASGNVYVADTGNGTLRKITPAGVASTLAGTAGLIGHADGVGAAASFDQPLGLAVDGNGNVYVADSGNNTIRKVAPDGTVSTLAGSAGIAGSTDGTGNAALFNRPAALALDGNGNLYIADDGNSTLRKLTPAGAVSTVVGVAGRTGFSAGPVPGVIAHPLGVAVSQGRLYFSSANGIAVVNGLP